MSREKVREIVVNADYCQMASCVDGQPRVRPMKFVITEDFRFWCSTVNVSGKIKEFEQNNLVELCWVDDQKNHLRVSGRVDLSGGLEEKRHLLELHPGGKSMFGDAANPRLVHVEVIPTRIRWKTHSFGEYNEVE